MGAIVALASVVVWLELGLSVPRFEVEDGSYQSIPRSGGEKNYVSSYVLSEGITDQNSLLGSWNTFTAALSFWRRVSMDGSS